MPMAAWGLGLNLGFRPCPVPAAANFPAPMLLTSQLAAAIVGCLGSVCSSRLPVPSASASLIAVFG